MRLRTWLNLFWAFLKVGTFTFGGGYAMLPLIHKEVVERKKWVSEEEIVDILAIAQSTPGVIAINSAVFIGRQVGGVAGALAAAVGVSLPAFLAIILILIFLKEVQNHPVTEKVMAGIRAASAALILLAAVSIGRTVLKQRSNFVVAALAFLAIVIFNINAAWTIVFGGLTGYLSYRWRKEGR